MEFQHFHEIPPFSSPIALTLINIMKIKVFWSTVTDQKKNWEIGQPTGIKKLWGSGRKVNRRERKTNRREQKKLWGFPENGSRFPVFISDLLLYMVIFHKMTIL